MTISEQPESAERAGDASRSAPGASAGGSRVRTWAHGLPAMRLQRARWRMTAPGARRAAAGGAPESSASPEFPAHIRLIRVAVGLTLVVLAWVGALVVYVLGHDLSAPVARARFVPTLALRTLAAAGACVLGVVVLVTILVAAFALSLALTPQADVLPPPPSLVAPADEDSAEP